MNVRKLLIFIGMLLVAMQLSGAKAKKPRIAVLDLTPAGVKADMAKSVTDILTTEFVNTNLFEVVERMQVAKILNEQGFQMTGVTDSSKAAELGKMLNTRRVIIGTLGKLGKNYVINIKIVDVEKANINFAEKQVAEGDNAIVTACEDLVNRLVYRITGIKPKRKATAITKSKSKEKKKKVAPKKKKSNRKTKRKSKEKDPVRRHAHDNFDELDNM